MNPTTRYLPLFFSLSFCISSNLLPALVEAETDPVWDTDGDPVKFKEQYYIWHGVDDTHTISLANYSDGSPSCPLLIVEQLQTVATNPPPLYPVTFHPTIHDRSVYIHEQTVLNFRFGDIASTDCTKSTVWTTAPQSGINFVVTGGRLGKPGCSTQNNWFKLERDYGSIYMIISSPDGVCSDAAAKPHYVSTWVFNRTTRLYVDTNDADTPLQVSFVKASKLKDLVKAW